MFFFSFSPVSLSLKDAIKKTPVEKRSIENNVNREALLFDSSHDRSQVLKKFMYHTELERKQIYKRLLRIACYLISGNGSDC